jgi:hypothetical protein
MSNAIVNLDQLLEASALKTKEVTVGAATVRIQELSVDGRDAFLEAVRAKKGNSYTARVVIALGLVGSDGAPLLNAGDAEKLADRSGKFVQDLAQQILKFSGLDDDEGNVEGSQPSSDSSTA